MTKPRSWKIWVCPVCPYIIEFNGNEEQMYCTGDGCGPTKMDWEADVHDGHKQSTMELVRVEEVE